MTKGFCKYFLATCILLLNASGFLHANDGIPSNSSKDLFFSDCGFVAAYDCHLVQSAIVKPQEDIYTLSELLFENDEDDELSSLKKFSERSTEYVSNIFFDPSSGCFFNNHQKIKSFYADLSYIPSHRYIMFHVFRI